ncbi:MAG: hypothetical protein GQ477_05605 [Nanohaloarchaea archaeon]|nr:hypothetical protein [Candidatus Nanohaloarchaea archaeon]
MDKQCAYLNVTIKLNSSRFKIESKDEKITVSVTERPKHNKVNIETIKNLERLLHKNVKIIKGAKSKRKTIKIEGITEDAARQMLGI